MVKVSTIFKILLGTILAIFVGTFLVEMYNVQTTSHQLVLLNKIAARQSCVLFSQETYKKYSDGGALHKINSIKDGNGQNYVSSDFYVGSKPEQVYNNLYGTESDFKKWIKTTTDGSSKPVWANWLSTKLINFGLNGDVIYGGSLSEAYKNIAKQYRNTLVTPLNMGIPYLDERTVEKMTRYHLTVMLKGDNKEILIKRDKAGQRYVYYKGFKVYADKATIKLKYYLCDLTTSDGIKEFKRLTNIEADKMNFTKEVISNQDKLNSEASYSADDELNGAERTKILIVGVDYSVPVAYEGITPIARAVQSIGEIAPGGLKGETPNTAIRHNRFDDSQKQNLAGGGIDGDSNTKAVTGKLMYYLVR